ncbi:MAG TPA: hypothetical protein VGH42_04825 [Verrucomicrobiae bacterium]|jgi:hypothetical protein
MNSPRRTHPTLFTQRNKDAGWCIIQAHSLLQEAIKNGKNSSFLMYAAFEMRTGIEQLMFTIIAACLTTKLTREVVDRCRKKDGLFTVLSDVESNYTLMCKFANALRAEEPRIPKIAEWDIKILKRRWNDLSSYCHSPLVIKDIEQPKWFEDGQKLIEETYDYFVNTLSGTAGTGAISSSGGPPIICQLQEDFLAKKITIEQVITRLRIITPMLSSDSLTLKSGRFKK